MPERYAIYYAPGPQEPLARQAARWLGRSADGDGSVEPAAVGIDPLHLRGVTRSPRRYGFHATLKAPMGLRPPATRDKLVEALGYFAAARHRVAVGPVRVAVVDGFLAIVPVAQPPALTALVQGIVAAFDPFRLPLTPAQREARIEAGLTPRQIELLDRWGYPFVEEEFRFHMTLTDRLVATDRLAVIAAAEAWFTPALPQKLWLDRIALFHEPEAGAPFRRIADFPLTATVEV